jgi:hypothetical protein
MRQRRTHQNLLPALLLLASWLTMAPEAGALPRYSARYGQSCHLCHHNPTGGGLRTPYASQYLVPNEIATVKMVPEELERIDPQLNENITVGVDLRSLIYEGEGARGSILDMQGDVYLALQMLERFSVYVDRGQDRTHEYFGMAYVLPGNGYVKTGRFTPAYGWRFADHQMAGRRYLLRTEGSDFPTSLNDAGLEVGISPGGLDVSASLLRGSGGNGDSYAGRAVLRKSVGTLNVAAGGSILRRQESSGHSRAAGGFGYVALGPASWLWQLDETKQDERLGLLVSQELAWQLRRGVDLRLTYSFQDPDTDIKNGSRTRWGLGLDTLPYPFFGVQLMGHLYEFEEGSLVTEADYVQAELVLHFLY